MIEAPADEQAREVSPAPQSGQRLRIDATFRELPRFIRGHDLQAIEPQVTAPTTLQTAELTTPDPEAFPLPSDRNKDWELLEDRAHAVTLPAANQHPGRRALQPGAVLGRYVLRRSLGQGGMGEVYEAYDEQLNRSVALKFIHRDAGLDELDACTLLEEAKSIAKISHPNIVTIFDVGTLLGHLYVSMEKLNGPNLRDWALPKTSGTGPSAREIVEQSIDLARAIEIVHREGLVHRDIKPENVVVDMDNQGRARAVLIDFGLAQNTGPTRATPALRVVTKPPAWGPAANDLPGQIDTNKLSSLPVSGTPQYMAPEQWSDGSTSPASDIFSLATTLHEMLCGQKPRPIQSEHDIQFLLPRDRSRLAQRLRPVLANALHVDVAQRTRRAEAFADALHHAIHQKAPMRWLLRAATCTAALFPLAFAIIPEHLQPSDATRCSFAQTQWETTWTPSTLSLIRNNFERYFPGADEKMYQYLEQAIHRFGDAWVDERQSLCVEVNELPMQVVQHQTQCFEEQLGQIRALRDVWTKNSLLDPAAPVTAIQSLPDPQACRKSVANDVQILAEQRVQKQHPELLQQLWSAQAMQAAGDESGTIEELRVLIPQLEAAQMHHLADEKRITLSHMLDQTPKVALDLALASYASAHRRGDLEVEAHSALQIAFLRAARFFDPKHAALDLRNAKAAMARMSTIPVHIELLYYGYEATIQFLELDFRGAARNYRQAVSSPKIHDPRVAEIGAIWEMNLGLTVERAEGRMEAIHHFRSALRRIAQFYGTDSERTLIARANLLRALVLTTDSETPELMDELQRQRKILNRTKIREREEVGALEPYIAVLVYADSFIQPPHVALTQLEHHWNDRSSRFAEQRLCGPFIPTNLASIPMRAVSIASEIQDIEAIERWEARASSLSLDCVHHELRAGLVEITRGISAQAHHDSTTAMQHFAAARNILEVPNMDSRAALLYLNAWEARARRHRLRGEDDVIAEKLEQTIRLSDGTHARLLTSVAPPRSAPRRHAPANPMPDMQPIVSIDEAPNFAGQIRTVPQAIHEQPI